MIVGPRARASMLLVWCLLPLASSSAQEERTDSGVEQVSPGVWPDRTFRWYYNPQNAPAWLGPQEARAIVQEAARQWETCGVRMAYQGETDQAPGVMDGRNVVGWSIDMPRQLRGITQGRAKAGTLLERDIAFRPDRNEFERFPRLLKKVIAHEFGHAIGLTHSKRCDDVMTLAADCHRRSPGTLPLTPTANDLARCHALYPPVDGSSPNRN